MSDENKTVVLVADDEPSTLALVSGHLRAKGYRVMEATDGDKAWELAHEHLPHIVVLDVMMPGMSGWEVCRKIREAVSLAHTGVVMLTGIGENLNEMTSPLYGADAYVDKPFEFADLDDKIKQTLSRRKRGALGRPDHADVTEPADDNWDLTDEQAPKPALAKSAERSEQGAPTLTQRITKAARKVAQVLNPLTRDAPLSSEDDAEAEVDVEVDLEGVDVQNVKPRRRRAPRSKPESLDKSASNARAGTSTSNTKTTAAKTRVAKRARQARRTEKSAAAPRTAAPTKRKAAARPLGKLRGARAKKASKGRTPAKRASAKQSKTPSTKAKRSAKSARSTRNTPSASRGRSMQGARAAKRQPEAKLAKRSPKPAAKGKGAGKRKVSTPAARPIEARAASGKRLTKNKNKTKSRAATSGRPTKSVARKASKKR